MLSVRCEVAMMKVERSNKNTGAIPKNSEYQPPLTRQRAVREKTNREDQKMPLATTFFKEESERSSRALKKK